MLPHKKMISPNNARNTYYKISKEIDSKIMGILVSPQKQNKSDKLDDSFSKSHI